MGKYNVPGIGRIACFAVLLALGTPGCGSHAPAGTQEVVSSIGLALTTEQRFNVSVPSGLDFTLTAVGAAETLQIGDRTQIQGATGGFAPVTNVGNVLSDFGVSSQVGSVTSVAHVALHNGAHVNGSLKSASTVSQGSGVVVTGGVTANTPLGAPDLSTWTVQFPQSSQNLTLTQGQSASLAPGAYGAVTVFQSARLTLRSGTYYFDQFDLELQGALQLDASAGPITIYVKTKLVYRGNMSGGTPDKLLVAYSGGLPVAIIESVFNGTLVAPSAPVRLGLSGATHSGAIFAKTVQIDPDVRLKLAPFAGWSAVPFDVVPRFECVESRADGSKVALFGHINRNAAPVTLTVGNQNQFLPGAADRRQPTTFLVGSATSAFAVRFTGPPPRWSLNGIDALVDTSKACSSSVQLTAIQDTTVKSAAPLANFGSDVQLTVASDQFSLANFDRNALIAARGTGRFIKSAHLRFSIASGSASAIVRPIRQFWSEVGATWTCGNDQLGAASSERCLQADKWLMPFHPGAWTNPYYKSSSSIGTITGTQLDFDVTEDVQRFISADYATAPMGWVIQASSSGTLLLGSREGGNAARLLIETIAVADTDLAGMVPFGFGIDPSLSTTETLPVLADGVPRTLGVLKTSEGKTLRYAEREVILMTDDAAQLASFKTRWGATELFIPNLPSQMLPGVATPHLLRIDPAKAKPETLVANLRRVVNRPDGLQSVSSDSALRLLAAFAEERARGTSLAVNWIIPGSAVTAGGFGNKLFVDGTPAPVFEQVEKSSNSFDWPPFGPGMHDVNGAWGLMYFAGKLKPIIDVAIIDTGFSTAFQDEPNEQAGLCASGSCRNPFKCGGGADCPWHGVHVASAGFGEPNNQKGGSGPGAGATNLTLQYGFGDMATLLYMIPKMLATGEEIVNISAAIPVPDYLFETTLPAEVVLNFTRGAGMLVFAAAGNENTNVDERRCFDLYLFTVCPWEKTTWFPCESGGVDCVGATEYNTKNRASYSNDGDSVGYWATGTVLSGDDPDLHQGTQFHPEFGTSVASPFMAGTAALTWAANRNQSAGDVEDCLSAAQVGGPNGRFVNTFLAAACGLGNPSNLAPLVEITNPSGEVVSFDQVGLFNLTAEASDYESGKITQIFWSSDVEGQLGSSVSGSSLLYQPSGPGNRTITASARDPQGAIGQDSVVLSFKPAPPVVQILAPMAGQQVFAGLPTDLIARVTNLGGLLPRQPCGTAVWSGFQNNSTLFTNLMGCSLQATFLNPDPHQVKVSMSQDGLVGSATQPFTVVDDGKLHVAITSPLRSTDLLAHMPLDVPLTLSAASNANGPVSVTYAWSVFNRDNVVTPLGPQIVGQSVPYTPTGPGCGVDVKLRFLVVAADSLGRIAEDSVDATLPNECPPR